MRLPTIEHPTGQANFTFVTVGPIELAFSYQTVIAFRPDHARWIVSENVWGPTTGKHLNLVPGGDDKANRVERGLFEAQLLGCLAMVTAGASRIAGYEDAAPPTTKFVSHDRGLTYEPNPDYREEES